MRALRTFTDESDETRKNGEEWLITSKDTEAHIPNVYEEVMKYDNYLHTLREDCIKFICSSWL